MQRKNRSVHRVGLKLKGLRSVSSWELVSHDPLIYRIHRSEARFRSFAGELFGLTKFSFSRTSSDSPAISTTTTTTTAEPSRATSVDPSNANFTLLKDENDERDFEKTSKNEAVHKSEVTGEEEPEISAADYNPDFDRREDEKRMERLAAANGGTAGSKGKEELVVEEGAEGEESGEEEDDDDEDDMFAIGTDEAKPKKKRKTKRSGAVPVRFSPSTCLSPASSNR